ncbi:MAG: RlpA-like double-psi beta-barrel domain-containing protein [Verrucomicrobiota bacterium]
MLNTDAQQQEGGLLRMYSDQLQGRATASGELYERSALTGAHATLPIGTFVRVANFETGRMVDVRINDRKHADSTLVHLSRAAAEHVGLSSNRAAQGSILVLGTMPPQAGTNRVSSQRISDTNNYLDQPAKKRFAPFQSLKRDPLLDAVNEPEKAKDLVHAEPYATSREKRGLFGKSRSKPVQYGIPADQYAAPTMAHNSNDRFVPGQGEIVPLSANASTRSAGSAPRPDPARSVAQPQALPYRVQFGAFRKEANAHEMNAGLIQSGLQTRVVPSSINSLHLVVTAGGFPSAAEAQRWIHYEGTRRGWRERPVVIR